MDSETGNAAQTTTPADVPTTDTKQQDIKLETSGQTQDAQTEAPKTPTWHELVDQVDPKELRRHPKIAGIFGSDLQQDRINREASQANASRQKKHDDEEKAFLDLVDGNIDYIKENYPKVYDRYQTIQQDRAERDLANIKGNTVKELGQAIGRAVQDVPEWKELTREDHEAIAKELVGKQDHDILPIFNKLAIDRIAEKRAQKRFEAWKAKELASEQKAIESSVKAKLLADSDSPDMTKPKGKPKGVRVDELPPDEFDKWWKDHKQSLTRN